MGENLRQMPRLSDLDSRQGKLQLRADFGQNALAENLCRTLIGLRQDHDEDRVCQLPDQVHLAQALAQPRQPGGQESAVSIIRRLARTFGQQHREPVFEMMDALHLLIEELENDCRSIDGRAADKEEFVVGVEQ